MSDKKRRSAAGEKIAETAPLKPRAYAGAKTLFGAFRVLKAALPSLRTTKGTVLFTSSVAGVVPIPYQAFYSAAKASINSLVMALRNELKGTGIRVAAVLPGDVKTGFTAAREKNEVHAALYPNEVRSVEKMEHDEQHGMSPDRIAAKFLKLSKQKHPKPFCSVGFAYSAVLVLMKLLPAGLANGKDRICSTQLPPWPDGSAIRWN